jgi:hypothetical protein
MDSGGDCVTAGYFIIRADGRTGRREEERKGVQVGPHRMYRQK